VSTSARTAIRWIVLGLLVLIAALQLKLWTGAGGMPDAWRLRERVGAQAEQNGQLLRRNQDLGADVQDLKEGREAVEERARSELGMVKPGEVFYQVVEPGPGAVPAPSEAAADPATEPDAQAP
jgi:cell division protein FtsB